MEIESNTSSDNSEKSDYNCSFNLTSSNRDDLEESIYLLLSDIITENPLLYSKHDFHITIENDIVNYFITNFVD